MMPRLPQAEFDYISALWHDPAVTVLVAHGRLHVGANVFLSSVEIAREREAEILRRETAIVKAPTRPSVWLTLPVQALACVVYMLFMLAMCAAGIVVGAVYLFAAGIQAIARGLRWALC